MIQDETTTSINYSPYLERELIDVIEKENSVELVYMQMPSFTYTTTLGYEIGGMQPNIFKIIYSIKDGKWNVSKPIDGEYVPAREEGYEFKE